MTNVDKILLTAVVLAFAAGIIGVFSSVPSLSLIALLIISLLLAVLLILQRRQLARVQQRTLLLLRKAQELGEQVKSSSQETSGTNTVGHAELEIFSKRLIGMLQAQQVSVENLHKKIHGLLAQDDQA